MNNRFSKSRLVRWLIVLVLLGLLAWGLAWISNLCTPCDWSNANSLPGFQNWLAFMTITMAAAGVIFGGWKALLASDRKSYPAGFPRWLSGLVIAAALLRLATGLFMFAALPEWGHGTPQENQGYVMSDAYSRDGAAWKIAQSGGAVWREIQENRKSDPYGGLLLASALVYRYTGLNSHQPLLVLVLISALSALTVLFIWAFARRAWDEKVARLAALGALIYPEAVLLGSALMREAVLIPLAAAAFYGLARLRRENDAISLAWIGVPLILTLPVSPPFTFLLATAIGILAFAARREIFHRELKAPAWLWLALAGLAVGVLVGLWLALRQFAPTGMTNPVEIVGYWIEKSTDLQAHFSKSASGWVQKVFINIPKWAHVPFLVVYGVLRPFLPAALVVGSTAPIWPWITLVRAAGWTVLLILLGYALLRAFLNRSAGSFTRTLAVLIWLGIFVASLRGGGDQDDNPRYRAVFTSIQVSLAAWGWVEYRSTKDPWFRRSLVTLAWIIFWSLLWYLRRYYEMPWVVADPFKTIGLGLACGVLYTLWDLGRENRPARKPTG